MKLTTQEYEYVQEMMVTLASTIANLPMEDFIADLQQSESVAYFVDPTLYRNAVLSGKVAQVMDMAEKFLAIKKEVRKYI